MRASPRQLAAVALLIAFAGCKKSSTPASAVVIGANVVTGAVSGVANGVKANGSNTVTISVLGQPALPVQLTTTAGTFPGGSTSASVTVAGGGVVLTTCDARTTSPCAGDVTVRATDAAGSTSSTIVRFVGFELVCNDGIDNNGDGRTDCADPDCDARACVTGGVAGTCVSLACSVAPACDPTAVEICNDQKDNNCNGLVDCADLAACDGKPCNTAAPGATCVSGKCTVPGGLALDVSPARARLPADGLAETTVTASATSTGVPLAGTVVTFTVVLPAGSALGGFVAPAPATGTVLTLASTTGADGKAAVKFRASDLPGQAKITAAFTAQQTSVSMPTTVTMPALGSLAAGAVQYPTLGARSSGWQEQGLIGVKVLDTDGLPYPDGLAVRFEHAAVGGSFIATPGSNPIGCAAVPPAPCVVFGATASPAGTPDAEGLARVDLYSGTVAGLVTVKASATAGGVTRSYTVAPSVAIVGAKVSGTHLSLECTPKNVPALVFDHDCVHAYGGDPITCTAWLADRFGNVLGRDTAVTFMSEAGSPDGTAFSGTTGLAIGTISVTGYGLPADVAPSTGEPQATVPDCLTGTRVANPRDGLVTIVAMAIGEEGFVDLNGNGVWDAGEPFADMGEPFVDVNDDGVWEPGEPFFDVNGNGTRDAGNGKWDADAVVWAETRVLYTGGPAVVTTLPAPPAVTVTSSAGGTATSKALDFWFQDQNLNPLSPAKTTYAVSSSSATSSPTLTLAPATVDNLGLSFAQEYCAEAPGTAPVTCSNVCPSAPCYVRTAVSSFSKGSHGEVTILGGSKPGTDVVYVAPTVAGITYPRALSIGVTIN